MSVYTISFMIADKTLNGSTYDDRYDAFMKTAMNISPTIWWKDTTSFIVIQTDLSITDVSKKLKAVIVPSADLFLIIDTQVKAARICGKNDDKDLIKLIPFLVET